MSKEQAIELLKAPKNRTLVEKAKTLHERLRLHTEASQDAESAGPAFAVFLNWCQKFLPSEKFEKFKMLLFHPLPTVELVSSIYSELQKALYGEDRYLRAEFTVDELESDYFAYLHKTGDTEFWRNQVFEAVKTAPNSVLIVDLPGIQVTERPEPFGYIKSVEELLSVEFNEEGVCEHISWKKQNDDGSNTYWFFDDEFFRTFTEDRTGGFDLFSEVRHSSFDESGQAISGPGYCPARALYSERISSRNPLRGNPITRSLGSLDKVLFWEASVEYYETYGAFPMYWMYKETCLYEDEEGNECENGYIHCEVNTGERDEEDNWVMAASQKKCPKCLARSIVGAGTVKEVDAPSDREDADLREPMGYVGVDVGALTYVEKRLSNRRLEIYRNCVGRGGDTPNSEIAVNEAQVGANFESRQSRLVDFKENFEVAHGWALKTRAIFRYGRERVISCTAYYGVEFYLQSERALQKQLSEQRAAGASQYQLAALRVKIDNTQYRENEEMRTRADILSQLEPYPDLSHSEVVSMASTLPKFIFEKKLELKSNFAYYVRKFERANMDIVRFGSKISLDQKISTIQQKLYDYVDQEIKASGPRIIPVGYVDPSTAASGGDSTGDGG